MNAALLQLATRCEREPASLNLKIAIAELVFGWREVEHDCHLRYVDPAGKIAWAYEIPDWLNSLDAAVTLVPEGCSWDIRFRSHHDCAVNVGEDWARRHPDKHSAHVWRMANRGLYDVHEHGAASTVPLAFCAAALRARALTPVDEAEEQVRGKRATPPPPKEPTDG